MYYLFSKQRRLFMERASRIMYSIANFFTWIVVICCIIGIVLSSLALAGIIPNDSQFLFIGVGSIVYLAIVLIVSLITIAMVRKAKGKNTSKGWDVLFIVLGVLGNNIFYVLGGIFGLIAPRR